jgi:hypothetical protein
MRELHSAGHRGGALKIQPDQLLGDAAIPGRSQKPGAAIILWNTVYLAAAVEQLKRDGVIINDDHLQHLSPLGWEHINLTGDFQWNPRQLPPNGQLRSLQVNGQR